ncbi:MAG: glycosyltransferase [Deltaproteobacteria bacterium]|nr:glycosyltransferase [Deltaproteobacteria bacterium]
MKITFFRHSLLSRGGDKMVLAHASNLATVGHQVTIMTNRVDTVFNINPMIRIQPLSFSRQLGTLMSALAKPFEGDMVIADIIPLACLLALRNKRVVYFAQDYDESYYASLPMKWLIRCLYHVSLRLFRVPVIAVSTHLAGLLTQRFKAQVMVVENGVDTGVFYPDPDPELITSKGERKAVLLLSRSDRRKGFDIARQIVACLRTTHQGLFEIWTVGERCPGIFPDDVHRDFGYVNEEEFRRIMSSADMFLYPTRHEGFGLMPLEGFACKCPVITTEVVPMAHHLVNAFVARIEDVEEMLTHAVALLNDSELAGGLVERAYTGACDCSLARSVVKFEAAVNALSREG